MTAIIAAFFIESDEADVNHEILARLDRIERALCELAFPAEGDRTDVANISGNQSPTCREVAT